MIEIETVSFASPEASAAVARSLHETGFAVLRDHPITPERIAKAYADWGVFFGSEEKHRWTHAEGSVDGYFPFRSENAKDSSVKDLKEFFHVYPGKPLPEALAEETLALHRDLTAVGARVLTWLHENLPATIADGLSAPLPEMIRDSPLNLLRVLHYPKLDTAPEPGAVRAAAHGDINLITCLLAGSAPGLEARGADGLWRRVPCDPGMMVINAGDMLDLATQGHYPSTVHRVVNPEEAENSARFSMPLFIHPRPEVLLSGDVTADDYLAERLAEIGLKS